MADGLTPGYLRRRARYWRARADKETDREKQIRLRQTAEILEREAEARALERPALGNPDLSGINDRFSGRLALGKSRIVHLLAMPLQQFLLGGSSGLLPFS